MEVILKNLLLLLVVLCLVFLGSCKSGKQVDGTLPGAELSSESNETHDEGGEVENEMQRIHFDYDKYNIRHDAAAIVEKNAEYLKSNPTIWIQIEGHCDERGSAEYNLALGEKRASAVKDYLIKLGIEKKRLSVISYGEEKALEAGSDEHAWSMNRRAEFIVVSKGK